MLKAGTPESKEEIKLKLELAKEDLEFFMTAENKTIDKIETVEDVVLLEVEKDKGVEENVIVTLVAEDVVLTTSDIPDAVEANNNETDIVLTSIENQNYSEKIQELQQDQYVEKEQECFVEDSKPFKGDNELNIHKNYDDLKKSLDKKLAEEESEDYSNSNSCCFGLFRNCFITK